MTDIPAIRKMLEGVTEGEWNNSGSAISVGGRGAIASCPRPSEGGVMEFIGNARFISAARTLVPQLCDEVERLTTWRDECVYLREEKAGLEAAIHSMKADENMTLALKQNAEQLQYEAERKLTAALARIAELEARERA